jgi:hypothetical protein
MFSDADLFVRPEPQRRLPPDRLPSAFDITACCQAFIERVHTRNMLLPRSKSGERKTVLDMLFSQSW